MSPKLFRTASFRLAVTYLLLFAASVMMLGWLLYASARATLEHELRTRVANETLFLLHEYKEDGLAELREETEERIRKSIRDRLYYFLQNAEGRVVFDELATIPEPGWHRLEAGKPVRPLLLYSVALKDGYRFAVAADLGEIATVEATLMRMAGWALLGTLIIGMLGGLVLSRTMLRRVRQIASTAEHIGSGNLSERITLRGSGDEFDQLGRTLNVMLDRIQQLVGNVQRVSTHIAHDLRTPLAHLRQQLEAMVTAPSREQAAKAIAKVDDILNILAALLHLGEIEAGAAKANFAPVDLALLMQRLAEAFEAIAAEQGQDLRYEAPNSCMVLGDKGLLQQLFANLLENTIHHAGRGASIRLSLHEGDGYVIATVADTGKGIPAHLRERVLTPFFRLDEHEIQPGHGLGLSLATAIAQLHGARLELGDNAPGLIVTIRFAQA